MVRFGFDGPFKWGEKKEGLTEIRSKSKLSNSIRSSSSVTKSELDDGEDDPVREVEDGEREREEDAREAVDLQRPTPGPLVVAQLRRPDRRHRRLRSAGRHRSAVRRRFARPGDRRLLILQKNKQQ